MKMIKKYLSAQVSLEFAASFVVLLLFLLATAKIFVWFGNNIVRRNTVYEGSRAIAGNESTTNTNPTQSFYYNQAEHPLHIFK